MKPRTYNLITSLCLLVALASAFAFDYAGTLKWLIGSSALLAAAIAAGTHFYNQSLTDVPEKMTSMPQVASNKAGGSETAYARVPASQFLAVSFLEQLSQTAVGQLSLFEPEEVETRTTTAPWVYLQENRRFSVHPYYRCFPGSENPIDVDAVVEIVEKLSRPEKETRFEFRVSAEGALSIRPIPRGETACHWTHISEQRPVSEPADLITMLKQNLTDKLFGELDDWEPTSSARPN